MWQGKVDEASLWHPDIETEKERFVSSHSGFKFLNTESVGFPMGCFEWEVTSLFLVQLEVGGEKKKLYLW